MRCRLCLQERELRSSHIIPEFLYMPGYDDLHRMEVVERQAGALKYIQKGFREPLLCADCEGLLANTYEDYFAKLWYITDPLPTPTSETLIGRQGISYPLFKLFHLSILWRASISALPHFRQVALGPHEDRIRAMLLSGDPGAPSYFQVFGNVVLFPATTDIMDGVIVTPTASRYLSRRIYTFVFGGCSWYYVEGDRPLAGFEPIALAVNGVMTLPVRDLRDIGPLRNFIIDHVRSTPR